mgnify:CR=1 FL=1
MVKKNLSAPLPDAQLWPNHLASKIYSGFSDQDLEMICDTKSFLYLNNTIIDFDETLLGRGFKFVNPQATNSCGCGESFGV